MKNKEMQKKHSTLKVNEETWKLNTMYTPELRWVMEGARALKDIIG